MKKLLTENKLVLLLLSALFIMFFLICYYSEATYDGGDGIRHYLVSRYSWQHHEQFLYSWGKPFFTLLSSPFSQFGLLGINVFNILCALSSGYICYKIAEQFNWKHPYLVIIFLCFTPCYFPTINSGLTEPLFGLVLIASAYLILKQKYLLSAVLVSFLPFVRSEGYFLLPLFFIAFVYHKKYLNTLWLGFGTLVYSVIGYFYYKDFLWLIHQNPYDGKNKAFYGQGELLHFVKSYNFIFGSALTVLFCVGIFVFAHNFLYRSKIKNDAINKRIETFNLILLIFGSFFIYFVAHSFMWWKGLANSLGLLRVMAAVAPCSALICMQGFLYYWGLT